MSRPNYFGVEGFHDPSAFTQFGIEAFPYEFAIGLAGLTVNLDTKLSHLSAQAAVFVQFARYTGCCQDAIKKIAAERHAARCERDSMPQELAELNKRRPTKRS